MSRRGPLYQCLRKVHHATLEAAQAAADSINAAIADGTKRKLKPGLLRPYRCPTGNHWHIGHEPRPPGGKGASRRV